MTGKVHLKLQKVKLALAKCDLKKSGHNKFSGYKYFELQDFMPTVIELFEKEKLCSLITFTNEKAELTVIDSESPDSRITIESPMSSASLKGCHDVQNLGAVQTYLRRYLFISLLDISEGDILDKTHDKNNDTDSKKVEKSVGQKINDAMLKKGMKTIDLRAFIKEKMPEKYNVELKEYTEEMKKILLKELEEK